MGGLGEETDWTQPSPFVRGSSFRTTCRVKVTPPRPPARLSSKQQDRPPRPPPRHTEELVVGRSQSFHHVTTPRPDSPRLPPLSIVNKSRSFSEEGRARLRSRDRSEPISTFFFPSTGSEASSNHDNRESWYNQHIPSPPLSPTHYIPHSMRRKPSLNVTTSCQGALQSPPPYVNQDSKKGFFSIFRRGTSSSPKRSGSPSTEIPSNYPDECLSSLGRNLGGAALTQPMMTRLQSRSQTPSPHRQVTPPSPHRQVTPPSPTTYRRVRHASSDTPPAATFQRSGSVPMQRSGLSQRAGADVMAAWGRIMSHSMRVPETSTQHKCPSDRGKDPWGDSAFMRWPLKSYSEGESQSVMTQAPLSPAPRLPDGGQEKLRVSGAATGTRIPPEDDFDQELEGSRTCLLPRPRLHSHSSPTPTHTQVVTRPSLSLRGAGRENGGFLDSLTTSSTSSGSPTTAPSCKTFTRPNISPDTRDSEDSGISLDSSRSGSSSSDFSSSSSSSSSSSQGRQGVLSPRNSVASAVSCGSDSPGSVSRSCSVYSTDSGVDVWSLMGSGVEQVDPHPPTDNFTYLLANDQEYLSSLQHLLADYRLMCDHTPSHIRQHFDLVFSHVEQITKFQEELHERLRETHGEVRGLATVLRDNHFQCYGRYIVMTPSVQKEFKRYSTYFQENFPDLLRNILKPTFRLNFYAQILESFKKECGVSDKKEVEITVEFLNRLKRVANTEMTLKAVVESPVDLRLGGDLLYQGELICLAAAALQKKKYCVILFENLLVITSSKMTFFKYKTHYRVEQVEKVEVAGQSELVLHVLTEGQAQHTTIKFRARTQALRNQWVEYLEKIAKENQSEGEGGRRARMVPGLRECSRPIPIDLMSLYPSLSSSLVNPQAQHHTKTDTSQVEDLHSQLILEEKTYVTNLSVFFNPETLVPPDRLLSLLEKLYVLHSKGILPILEKTRSVGEIMNWFLMNLELFNIYREYLVARSEAGLDQDMSTPKLYISPIQHFTFYLAWLQHLASHPDHSSAAKKVHLRLHNYVRQAQLQLLKQTIVSGRVDFHRSGDFIRYDKMDVRTRKKEVRGGSYYALLFENVIILTKPKPPFYEYTWDIWLDQANLGPPAPSDSSFKLEVRQGGGREPVTYDFSASSPAVKQEWLSCIHNQMMEQANKIRRRLSY